MTSRFAFLLRSRRQTALVAVRAVALAVPATAFAAGDLFQDISELAVVPPGLAGRDDRQPSRQYHVRSLLRLGPPRGAARFSVT